MPQTELIDIAAARKILFIEDTLDDPTLEKQGEIWADALESDLAAYADEFPLTGENKNKAIRCVTLGIASGYKNSKNNEKQAKYYLDLYDKAIDSLKSQLQTKPQSARVSVSNSYVTRQQFFQKKRL